jgi:DNA-binding NarL/FixJ family response regulator
MLNVRAPKATRAIRVAVVEPQPLVRLAIGGLLAGETDIAIVASEPSVAVALQTIRDEPVDVALVRVPLTGQEAVPAIQWLRRECPTTAIVVLGHRHDDGEVFWALQAGAAAHVADATRPHELGRVIRAVANGEYIIDAEVAARPVVARRVLDSFRDASYAQAVLDEHVPPREFVRLTRQETEVLTAISEGLTNKEIAARLSISQHTVSHTVKSVLRKLAVNNRTRAVLLALREHWIPVPDSPASARN